MGRRQCCLVYSKFLEICISSYGIAWYQHGMYCRSCGTLSISCKIFSTNFHWQENFLITHCVSWFSLRWNWESISSEWEDANANRSGDILAQQRRGSRLQWTSPNRAFPSRKSPNMPRFTARPLKVKHFAVKMCPQGVGRKFCTGHAACMHSLLHGAIQ